MKNPIIVKIDNKDEILLSDEDVMSLIREKLGDEVAAAVQGRIDDLEDDIDALQDEICDLREELDYMNDSFND